MDFLNDIFGYKLGDVFDYRSRIFSLTSKTFYQYRESGDLFRTFSVKPLKSTFYDFDCYRVVVNTSIDNKIGAIEAQKIFKTRGTYDKASEIIMGRLSEYLKDKCIKKVIPCETIDSSTILFIGKNQLNRFCQLTFNDRDQSILVIFKDYGLMKKSYKDNYGLFQAPVTERKFLMIDKGKELITKEFEDIPGYQPDFIDPAQN